MKIKVGYGYDIHRLEKGDSSLLLAGVKVSSPYREKIQNSLSSLFSLEKEDVNVAFNTKEGLGAVGQNEAIEVTSLVTVKKD